MPWLCIDCWCIWMRCDNSATDLCNILGIFSSSSSSRSNRWIWDTRQIDNRRFTCSGHCYIHREPTRRRASSACSHAGMALDAAGYLLLLLRTDSLHPCTPPTPSLLTPPPRGQTGMVSSRRTCHCHRGGGGSRSVRAEGGVVVVEGGGHGTLHPLPAIAVRRLLLWSHTRKTFPFPLSKICTSEPWRSIVALAKVNGFLHLSVSNVTSFRRSAPRCTAAAAEWMCVSRRVQASDNGASRGNVNVNVAASLLTNWIYALCYVVSCPPS